MRRRRCGDHVFLGAGRSAAPAATGRQENLIGPRGRFTAMLLGASVLAACTSSSPARAPSTPPVSTHTVVVTETATARPRPYRPPPATTVHPLPPGTPPPPGERAARCPYIRAGLDAEPGPAPTVADIEGDRVGRVTVLTGYRPVGCRFYFAYPRHEAVADILPSTFATGAQARNAMVRTARAGRQAQTYPNFVPGLTGVSYRTTFFGPDGHQDWAFVFAKGTVMVVVHTQQTRSSSNARYLAAAIAGEF